MMPETKTIIQNKNEMQMPSSVILKGSEKKFTTGLYKCGVWSVYPGMAFRVREK